MAQGSFFTTESEIHQHFMEKIKSGEEAICPVCDRFAKVYRKQIHTGLALQLIRMFKKGDEYVHTSYLIPPGNAGSSDFGQAKHWGFIEAKPHEPGVTKTSGWWKLTTSGKRFIAGADGASKYALVYNDEVLKFEGDIIFIQDCLGNKFNYTELMQNV